MLIARQVYRRTLPEASSGQRQCRRGPACLEGETAMTLCAEPGTERGYVHLDDRTLAAFLAAERSALVIVGHDCSWCQDYLAGIEIAHSLGELHDVPVGVLVLDEPGSEAFVRDNDWLSDAEGLPYTALYREGRRIDGFVAFNVFSMIDRLEYLAFLPEPLPRMRRSTVKIAA
jgi:hypothetical protein